ncbi:MAG: histidine phosphatase family protein [Nocardioides sp.]
MTASGRVYLVRHGRPLVDPAVLPHLWQLDPEHVADVVALRSELPGSARWYSSPEPKARPTARLLTDDPVRIVPGLREHERRGEWEMDFQETVRRAFEHPEAPAHPGWEPLAETRERVVSAVRGILRRESGRDVVLVGHGTAWTLAYAALRDEQPDLSWWSGLAMPDARAVDVQSRGPGLPSDMLGA